MTKEGFDAYLKDRYEDQIGWYDRKAGENQTKYRRMQWSLIILAALSPVLFEVRLVVQWLGHIPTVTSTIVAILTAGLKAFKYQENWINYRTTCETLRKEKHFYDAELNDYRGAKDKEAVFVDRVESLISRENTMWLSAQKRDTRTQEEARKRSS